jgi:hypothetical protein
VSVHILIKEIAFSGDGHDSWLSFVFSPFPSLFPSFTSSEAATFQFLINKIASRQTSGGFLHY